MCQRSASRGSTPKVYGSACTVAFCSFSTSQANKPTCFRIPTICEGQVTRLPRLRLSFTTPLDLLSHTTLRLRASFLMLRSLFFPSCKVGCERTLHEPFPVLFKALCHTGLRLRFHFAPAPPPLRFASSSRLRRFGHRYSSTLDNSILTNTPHTSVYARVCLPRLTIHSRHRHFASCSSIASAALSRACCKYL